MPRGDGCGVYALGVSSFRIRLLVAFSPALSIARQQRVMDALETLRPESLDFTDAGCALTLLAEGPDSEAARNDAESSVARVLFDAGHTVHTAPITTQSVTGVG